MKTWPTHYSTTEELAVDFKQVIKNSEDHPWLGCPELLTIVDQVDVIHHIILNDQSGTVRSTEDITDSSVGSVHIILTAILVL